MKTLLAFLSILFLIQAYGQNLPDNSNKGSTKTELKQFNIIKVGASARGEAYSHYKYYYEDYDDYDGGYNVPVFISYEHIWQHGDKVAFGIEPMLGVSFRNHLTSFFVGTEFKMYWANKGFWRMGISLNPSYTYGADEATRRILDENGDIQQVNIKLHYNIFSFDPGLIPFQFRIKNSPVIIESVISIIGFNVVTKTTGPIETADDNTTRYTSTEPRPYFLKYELKIGFVLP